MPRFASSTASSQTPESLPDPPPHPAPERWLWDVFCDVVDNHGDVGVSWRLVQSLLRRGQRVRLWISDIEALHALAPETREPLSTALSSVLSIHPWPGSAPDRSSETQPPDAPSPHQQSPLSEPGDIWLEMLSCNIPEAWLTQPGLTAPRLWLNLEYLSAEPFVERAHGLPSPVQTGPFRGLQKWFFYPGLTPRTGGLLYESAVTAPPRNGPEGEVRGVLESQDWGGSGAEVLREARAQWLANWGLTAPAQALRAAPHTRVWSLFCYEPEPLPELLRTLLAQSEPQQLWVTAGRAAQAVAHCLHADATLRAAWEGRLGSDRRAAPPHTHQLVFLPWLPQTEFDRMLRLGDINLVRGEDSLAQALACGKPLLWQLYPQHDHAHHAKLEAFLDWLQAPPELRALHRSWNGIPLTDGAQAVWPVGGLCTESQGASTTPWDAWQRCAREAQARLLALPALPDVLLDFAQCSFSGRYSLQSRGE